MMERKVYRDVILNRLRRLDLGWFFHKAYVYLFLRLEKYLKTGYSPAPLICGLVVTENCDMRCPMCVLPHRYQKDPREESTDIWKRVIDDLHGLHIGGIAISGGEPTLRKDVGVLLAHAKNGATTVTLNSNMAALTDAQILALASSGMDNINVSIDSGRDDVSDLLRGGRHVLARVLARVSALRRARDEGRGKFSITAVTTLSDRNIDDLNILFEKVAQAGADRICFIPLHDVKDGITFMPRSGKVKSDLAGILRALSLRHGLALENSRPYLESLGVVMTGGVMKERCNAGYTGLVIGADLKIYRCVPYMNTERYLFQWDPSRHTLKELWNSPVWRKDRLKALSCKECFWDCHAEANYIVPM